MKTKPFNLEEAKAGARVVTRDGKDVRIVCFNVKSDYPIVALVTIGTADIESVYLYDKQGKAAVGVDESNDLFLVSEDEELTEFENKLADFLLSLKPQPHWKPSEQNIKDLEWCADLVKDKMGVGFHRLQVFIDELRNL